MAAVALFDSKGHWQDTLVCEQRIRAALQSVGAVPGNGPTAGGPRVLQPEGDAGVFYLPRDEGWLGVLCEAGEWVALPAELAAVDDAQARGLPSPDDFIAHLLSLLGEDAED